MVARICHALTYIYVCIYIYLRQFVYIYILKAIQGNLWKLKALVNTSDDREQNKKIWCGWDW